VTDIEIIKTREPDRLGDQAFLLDKARKVKAAATRAKSLYVKESPDPTEESTVGITMKLEEVTPEKAGRWLEKNEGNRNFNQGTANALARQMLEGFWTNNGETIKFYEDGNLMDGQHRLDAVRTSGVTIKMYVVRGLPVKARATIDQQRKRTAGDILKMEGIPNGNRLAAIVRMVNLWDTGVRNVKGFRSSANFSPSEIVEALGTKDGALCIQAIKMTQTKEILTMAPPRAAGLLAVLALRSNKKLAITFFEQLESGIDMHEGDPVLTLRRYWSNLKARGKGQAIGNYLMAGVRAWNAYVEGRKITQIYYKSQEIPEVSRPGHPAEQDD